MVCHIVTHNANMPRLWKFTEAFIELAHNKQMNHSKAFWAVRNELSAEMKALWAKGYTGDGLWGRGVLLENGAFSITALDIGEVMPEHMCGGTFRSKSGKKRKAKPKITHKEKEQRKIARKFGVNGVALGADDEAKAKLEKGKRPPGKPRVAGSVRGRELRAAAALARFDVKKEEPQMSDDDLVTDSEAESGRDDTEIKAEPDAALDINGLPLLDHKGGGMVRVCDDKDNDDVDVKKEWRDLQSIPRHIQQPLSTKANTSSNVQRRADTSQQPPSSKSTSTSSADQGLTRVPSSKASALPDSSGTRVKSTKSHLDSEQGQVVTGDVAAESIAGTCSVCSVVNEPTALTCMVCLNVLRPEFMPNLWLCSNSICNKYLNSGDVSCCGVCGARKSS
jgi:hypothetical protein